jgi:UDP-N-acetylmuramoyl-tripeptide--D-alanyl-D-alanine ligase
MISTLIRIRAAIAWRLHKLLGDRIVYGSLMKVAHLWRSLLTRPVIIGVTGSGGKTTTKELLLGMLATQGKGVGNLSTYNNIEEIAKAILRLRPTHRFFVSEVSGHLPNAMDRPLAFLRPSIGVVTVVKNDHQTAFDFSQEAIAREKQKLVASLPASGTAVLNADDPLVLGMAASCTAKVLTFGLSPTAQLRAENISSDWPKRLELTLAYGSQRVQLHAQLCGTHWIPPVLGTIGVGLAMGMTLQACADGIASVAPFTGRMQPITSTEGVTFIRDDFKAPLWTMDSCFEFMRTAQAKRKIIVVGMLSECGTGALEKKYIKVARRAQEIADITIFVGPFASHVLKARSPQRKDGLHAFSYTREATQFINAITREGDLVLLKGTNKQEHLERVILARTGDIQCWRNDCSRIEFCSECPDRTKPSGLQPPKPSQPVAAGAGPAAQPAIQRAPIAPDEQVLVGLGNPGDSFKGTPHNVGYEVVDRMAAAEGLSWETFPDAWIARGQAKNRSICLVKMRVVMNYTGAELKKLSEELGFDHEQCILLYDDLDMPLGAVRARLRGGAAGHRGVASVLEAFQTDDIRRVKIGIKPKAAVPNNSEFVLRAFAESELGEVDQAIVTAATRAFEMVQAHTHAAKSEIA